MSATTRDKLEFVYAMAKHSDASIGDLQRLMRYSTTLHRLAETECNREMTVAEIRKQERIQMDVIAILAPIDCEALFGGDPRGCVVKIKTPDGYTNDFGREGVCVPA